EPAYGVGIDNRPTSIGLAKEQYPELTFLLQEPEEINIDETFDYIFMINAAEIILDLQGFFENLRKVCTDKTRIICITYNYLWEPIASITESLKLKLEHPSGNWVSANDLDNLLYLTGFQSIKTHRALLMPFHVPLLSSVVNKFFGRFPCMQPFNFLEVTVARMVKDRSNEKFSVSVIIPCMNEKGNVEPAVTRLSELGSHTEIIFVDDYSPDGTADEIKRVIDAYPEKDIKLFMGPQKGKAQSDWVGFDNAKGDIVLILDADLTVAPEEIPSFLEPIYKGYAEFVNGSRLIYPMESQAMRAANIIANKFFGYAFTFLLGQRVKDTLCGTKVLFRRDYERLKYFRKFWGDFDKFGDFELLFGAANLHLKIIDLPIHYRDRTYGETKINKRIENGIWLLKMCFKALRFVKYV
ncbi:MAG: glycosyltransferase, partial [Candidatus Coatesbacteria bacterium]|nr:glycosyltransferase [Candidatus Coatesbacteria bacterium]